MQNKTKNTKIILASGSPRRQQLLRDIGFEFEIRLKEVEEIYPETLQKEQITDYLSKLKAVTFRNDLAQNELLITSDTIVWHNNQALGKPKDKADAFNILTQLSNDTHEVFTSVCFTTLEQQIIINDCTKVTFKALTETEINFYIDTYKPFDKAGSYGIQEWIGYIGVTKIEGSYTNIMGFPTEKVNSILKNLF